MLKTLALSASVLAFASGLALAETTLSTNLVIDSNGNVTAAIITVSSGFLGVNQKDVVIPFKELKVSTRDGKD